MEPVRVTVRNPVRELAGVDRLFPPVSAEVDALLWVDGTGRPWLAPAGSPEPDETKGPPLMARDGHPGTWIPARVEPLPLPPQRKG